MNPEKSPAALGANEEVSALIATLHQTGQRLEELTAGEVDSVADRDGRTFLLRHAQERLRHSEAAKQAAILNALPAHIALLDTQGLIISVNDGWRQFAGANAIRGPGYGIGLNYLEICDRARGDGSSEAHQAAEGIRSVLGGEAKSFSIEYPCHSPAEQRWFLMTVTPLADNQPNGAVVMHLDITERRRTQAALAQSEDGLHRAEVIAKLAHVITGPDGSFERWSETLPRLVGVLPAQLPRTTWAWLDLLHPDDRSIFRDKAIEAGVKKLRVELEYRVQRADGEWINVRHTMEPLKTVATSGLRWFNTLQDVTAETRAEQNLRESERRFSSMLGNMQLISVMLDRDARITYCNEYLLRLTGWRHEEVIGRSWVELFIPPETGDLKERLAALLSDQPEGRHGENKILTRSGERRLIRWNNSVLRSGAGDVIGTASIGEDITEQKRAETRISRLNRVYAVLSGINTLIVRVRDREELFREACRIAVEHGKFRMAWIGVVDKEAGLVKPVAFAGDVRDFFETAPLAITETKPGSHGLAGRAVRNMKPVISNDVHSDPQRLMKRELAERNINSVAVIPLIVGGEAIGVLALYSTDIGFFDEEEMRLLGELAGDISFAIAHIEKEKERKRAEIRIKRLNRVYAVLSGINTLIVRVRDRDELFREACRIAVEAGGFPMTWIGMVDRSAMKISLVASAGVNEELLTAIKDRLSLSDGVRLGNNMAARAIREKKAGVSNDAQNDAKLVLSEKHVESGVRSMAMLPLIVSDEAVGVLGLYSEETGFFDEEEMKLLTELAGDIGFALDHIEKGKKLNYLAYYDELTGLANRTLFLERVAQYIRSAVSGGHKLALFLVDLERFKSINDSLGRPAGDALLRQVAEWLTRNLGDANLVARVGADHFAVVLPEVKREGNVAQLVEKTLEAFLEHPFRLNDSVFRIAFKTGVALFPDDGTDADTLFRNAEAALKKAKARGDRYLFYKQKMTDTVAGKLTLENQLRQALDKGEFVLHYQPKVNLVSGKLTSAEALIRWNDPRTGLVPPGRFIPILEETGLIHEVGRWALRKAIEEHLRWRTAGLAAVRISVNVSSLQLRNAGFIAEIKQAIGIDAHAAAGLELELTESMIMEDVKHNIASLQAIRALGVTIAIDDFGTGFSSLAYLSKLPVDTLKIDRSFVIDMTAGPEGLALVSTIINLAHSLKLKVVAEGVETEEQSRLLRLLNCDEMQGYLFSKPVPSEIFETRFLASPAARPVKTA